MSIRPRLVLGTTNKKKLAEMRLLLEPLGFPLSLLSDFDNPKDVDETGTTFLENARLKATEQAVQLQSWTIGEDSGLVVDALGGAPGIYSARFSGPGATDASNNALLLEKLANVPIEKRTAHYVSAIALANPKGEILIEAEGRCWGRILTEPRGAAGFGYDPLFEVREYHQTFAELGSAAKSVLSHRARSMEQFKQKLIRLADQIFAQ